MSFRCGRCSKAQPAGTRPIRVVMDYAEREYRDYAGVVTQGWEIVSEANVCQECYGQLELVDGPPVRAAS